MPRSLAHRIASRAPSIQQKSSGRWTQPRSTFRVPSRSRSRAGRIRHESAEDLLEKLADRVANEDVALLDTWRRGGRNAEAHVAEVAYLATALAGQADHGHPFLSSRLDGPQDVAAVATRGDGEENIPCPPVSADFTREDLVIAVVVADRSQRRGVTVEGEGRQRFPVTEEATRQLRRD